MKHNVAIMDFGTSKITVLIGSRGINNSICVEGIGISEYDGYCAGDWLGNSGPAFAIEQAIKTAETRASVDIHKLYIGVPCDFSECFVKDVSIAVNKRRKITEADVEALQNVGNDFVTDGELQLVNVEPVYYALEDNHKLIAPVGMPSGKLAGRISYMFARTDFIRLVTAAVNAAGVEEVEFVSQPLAELLFLFDGYKRDRCVTLVDIGALCTSVIVGQGDGVCRQYFFPWGGDKITCDLAAAYEIPYDEADKLKRKVVLSLDPDFKSKPMKGPEITQTEYVIEVDNEEHSFPVSKTNDIVKNEIKKFVRYVEKTLKVCDYKYPEYMPLYITGGGLNHIRGAVQFVSSEIRRDVEAVRPNIPMPELDKPEHSSVLGLMDMVLASEAVEVTLGEKIKRWFSRR